ncbi:M20 family metallopeptidase [Vineibacter terrae]|uniref:M20 family metallopeptidase n=1 Tax=Vineibacter terrae TaxID=2586908 RepID=A0A5C8PBJ4_9HYPH|nr:M20 family metallopeptidase [Vineibacter terrae]TXL71066.1 M20 family metallopeptidase [Vineibacter terrae]
MPAEPAAVAAVPFDSIIDLASRLVSIPSRAGIDAVEPILDAASGWLEQQGLAPARLRDAQGRPVALLVRLDGRAPGPAICLNACLDTAPFGDESRWRTSPSAGLVADGKLWGRGAADSKMGVSILAHVARFLTTSAALSRGTVYVLFDADEHTGAFGGVKAFLAQAVPRPLGAALGYPGDDALVIGSRGFLRVKVHVAGQAGHSGAVADRGMNAISKAAALISAIDAQPPPRGSENLFTFGPCATVTRIEGGEGFSQIPDRVVCNIDIRLTPGFDHDAAQAWLDAIIAGIDARLPAPAPTRIEPIDHWPPYAVAADHPLVAAFLHASRHCFGRDLPALVCGPSNIGNYLAAHGVPTVCAPGVAYANIHGTDECADLSTVPSVYSMYCAAVLDFLHRG